MTTKEKKLLGVALLIFAAIILPFKLLPLAMQQSQAYRETLGQLHDNIERYRKLEEQAEMWRERHAEMLEQEKAAQASLLSGSTRDLVAARLQGVLKELAQQAGVQVQSLDLPEFSTTTSGQWLLVTQNVRFNANSDALWKFIRSLTESPTKLAVISLDARAQPNNQLNGAIKITGFSSEAGTPPPVPGG